jgi:polyisoprenyl-teichoic acid--peptidoglycan teichoic acid transferase
MTRHDNDTGGPRLRVRRDNQPHLYRKRRFKRRELRGRNTSPHEPNIHLDGDQPNIYKTRRIKWTSVLKWSAIALVIILLVVFIWGYVWLKSKEGKMHVQGVDEALDSKKSGQPVTTLVMGVDKGSVPGETESRTDIMMLVSVNPANNKAAVISIPRDTRVKIAGQNGYNKINAAHAFGGTKLAIQTVKDFTGLDINHYVEMDFVGFKAIVDAIGGVKMHVDVAINDKYAGKVPAGDVVLTGDQALALVRARHDVHAVPAGDLDRIKNQRRFLQAMLSNVSHVRNPFKVIKLVDVASKNIKTDLSFTEMLSLGRRLQGAGKNNLTMTTAPGTPKVINGVWYYLVDMPEFQSMLSTFKTKQVVDPKSEEQSSSSASARASISVVLLNGTGTPGLAGSVASELQKAGFSNVRTGNSESTYSKTTIYYADDNSSKAGMVAADLAGVQEPMIESSDAITSKQNSDVVVVLGTDYAKP